MRLILILLIVGLPFTAMGAGRILSVQSISISPYEEAIDGFSSVCTLPMDRLLISDVHSISISEQIRRVEPDLILAVGLDALKALDDIDDIPIVFVMLLYPEHANAGRENITGINMVPSTEVQLRRIQEIFPNTRNIGVLFDPENNGQFIQTATDVGCPLGIELISVPVTAVQEVPSKLMSIQDQAELIWMIPDVTVITSQTVEFFLLFSMENKIPLIAFSEKYVSMGAFMAFGLDAEDMGRQAGEMANTILEGTCPDKVPVQDARSVSVTVNRTLCKKFGIRLDEAQLEKVKLVE